MIFQNVLSNCADEDMMIEGQFYKKSDFNYTIIKTSSNSRLELSQVVEPLMMTRDSFTSQSNIINQYNPVIEYSKDFSKSTTALEDLYAKVIKTVLIQIFSNPSYHYHNHFRLIIVKKSKTE